MFKLVERSKPNYAFKSKVLREHSDLLKRQNQASYVDYCKRILDEDGVLLYGLKNNDIDHISNDDLYVECCFNGLKDEFLECEKMNKAYYERLKRLKTRVRDILTSGPSLFLTLTFNDDALERTSPEFRRIAVQRYLKQYKAKYVGNIDFGKTNHREHYHALIGVDRVDNESWNKYGNIDFERVRIRSECDSLKLSKYINKLSNHAIKETTKRSALIYSR